MISVVPKVMGDGNTTVGVFLLIFIIEENAKFQLEVSEKSSVWRYLESLWTSGSEHVA